MKMQKQNPQNLPEFESPAEYVLSSSSRFKAMQAEKVLKPVKCII